MLLNADVLELMASEPIKTEAKPHTCAIKKVADAESDFPSLPKRETTASLFEEETDSFEDGSSECCASIAPAGQTMHLHDLLRASRNVRDKNAPLFRPKKTIAEDCVVFKYCDDREDNERSLVFKGDRVVLFGVEEFPEETWYLVQREKRGCKFVRGWINSIYLESGVSKQDNKPVAWATPVEQVPVETEPKTRFVFQQLAMCCVDSVWKKATVVSTEPLRVQVLGESDVLVMEPHNVKKCETTSMVTVTNSLPVRAFNNPKSVVVSRLPKGSAVEVAAFHGHWAKINAPMVGWIQFRDEYSFFILESSYQKPLQEVRPTLIFTNLPASATEQDVLNCLSSSESGNRLPFDLHRVQIDVKNTAGGRKAKVSFNNYGFMRAFLAISRDQDLVMGENTLAATVHTGYLCYKSCPKNWSRWSTRF